MRTLATILLLIPWCLSAADTMTNAELKIVDSALQPILEKLDPKPDITFPNNSATLVVSYRSQLYKIHDRSMTGEISPNVHDEMGPSFKGFILRVYLQDKGEANQAVTSQTLHEPYWRTHLDVAPIGGTQKQIYWVLSYGSRTDTNLLAQIRQTLSNLKDVPNKSAKPTSAR